MPVKTELANFYQKNFSVALLNWEINRQEDRLETPREVRVRK